MCVYVYVGVFVLCMFAFSAYQHGRSKLKFKYNTI